MAAQFGRWNFDGHRTPAEYLDRARSLLAPYGPEGSGEYNDCGVSLLWFSFETSEANPKRQPYILDSGEILLWDGRLDNGPGILRALGRPQPDLSSDIEVVAAAWREWGESCFARFVGDWSLSLWTPRDRRLFLAVDFLASRHLCYLVGKDGVQWSSVPDPLILLSEHAFALDEEYLAGWLGCFPSAHLTPFREIHRVPPASTVRIRPGSVAVRRYWDFDGSRRIRYARDAEYEAHFLDLFRQSVRRRLRSNSPLLAELSGGMDSSAIVCVADQLTDASARARIDTVSLYNDDEPHWNERPWFSCVESKRGKAGLHVDVTVPLAAGEEASGMLLGPGASTRRDTVLDYMMQNGHRVLLSGIGGDEFLGGVPSPLPELEDLLAEANVTTLCRRLFLWALALRRPFIHVLTGAAAGFLPCELLSPSRLRRFGSWLDQGFVTRQKQALTGYPKRLRLFGALPSFQENVDALDGIRRQLSCKGLSAGHPYERRYPCLDRDLLEFLFAIPREQLVRPGERRSLMRRALTGIVPKEILERRRKAYLIHSPLCLAERHFRELSEENREFATGALGIVEPELLLEALRAAGQGNAIPVVPLMRAVSLERWLRRLSAAGLPVGSSGSNARTFTATTCRRQPPLRPAAKAEAHL